MVHWTLAGLIAFSWWSVHNHHTDWHIWSGIAILTLLIFRLLWGFVGSSTARFRNFVRGPRAILGYLRSPPAVTVGHNPLGALSVLALLGLLLLQIVLGLFAVDVDGIESGPLSLYVSFETGRACAEWHEVVFNALLALIALHILAVLYYRVFKKQNLIGAMLTGKRVFEGEAAPLTSASLLRVIIGMSLSGVITYAVSQAFQL